jgi:predicted ATPase
MDKYCQAVLSQEHKPLEDKFDVYNTLIDNTANHCKVKEAANMLLDILAKFNCRFPTNPALIGFGVLFNVMKIKATMKSRNTSDLPFMQDAVRVNLMQLLDKLITCLYMLEDDRLPLVIFRTLNWTMKYGNCASSAPGFALAGMILTGTLGDLQGGSTYGQHALTLLKNMQTMTTAARTMFCVYSFLFPWTQQARSTLKPLLQAYDIGLRTG